MRNPNHSTLIGVLAIVGLGGCAVDADEPAATEAEPLIAASTQAIATALADDAGVLHRATIIASRDVADHAQELLAGAHAILATGKASTAAAATTFAQRTAQATTAVAKAADGHATGLLAVVFEDSQVIGWSGPLRVATPTSGHETNGGRTYLDVISTTNSQPFAASSSQYCPAGAGMHGNLSPSSTGMTTETMNRFRPYTPPLPPTPPVYAPVLLANGGTTTYNYPATFIGDWYYLTSSQTVVPNLLQQTAVFNYIDCYWFGL